MSNNVPAVIPQHIQALMGDLMDSNKEAMGGISAGFPAMIGLKGTRFVIKEDGQEQVLKASEIAVVILKGKPTLDKDWYATKYDPNATEHKAPDCFSRDGQRPDPQSKGKQAEACAGCPHNQFGSGTSADGSAGKGKACSDSKMLAVSANGRVYGFRIPPASLKAFGTYIKQLDGYGLPLPSVITKIGFDEASSYPVLTFAYEGVLDEKTLGAILPLRSSNEVAELTGSAPKALPAPAPAPTPTPAPAPAPAPAPEVTLGFATEAPAPVDKKKAPLKAVKAVEPEDAEEVAVAAVPTDDALRSMLQLG